MAEVTQREQQSLSGWKKCTLTTVEAACLLQMVSIVAMDIAIAAGYINSTQCEVGEDLDWPKYWRDWLICVTTRVFSAAYAFLFSVAPYSLLVESRCGTRESTLNFNQISDYVKFVLIISFPIAMNLYAVRILSHPIINFAVDFVPMIGSYMMWYSIWYYVIPVIVFFGPIVFSVTAIVSPAFVLLFLVEKLQEKLNFRTKAIPRLKNFFLVTASLLYVLLSTLSFFGIYNDINDDYGLNVLSGISCEYQKPFLFFPKESDDGKATGIDLAAALGILPYRVIGTFANLLSARYSSKNEQNSDETIFLCIINGIIFYSFFPKLRHILSPTADTPVLYGVNWIFTLAGNCSPLGLLYALITVSAATSLCSYVRGFVEKNSNFTIGMLMVMFRCMLNCCTSIKAGCLNLFSKLTNDTESSHVSVVTGLRSAESVITTPRSSRNCCASLFSFCSSRQRYRRASDVTVLTGMRSEESFDLEYGNGAGLALAKAQ